MVQALLDTLPYCFIDEQKVGGLFNRPAMPFVVNSSERGGIALELAAGFIFRCMLT